jgi:hypothetical protein
MRRFVGYGVGILAIMIIVNAVEAQSFMGLGNFSVKLPAHRAGLLTGRGAPPTIARSAPTCPDKEAIF